MSKPIHHGRYMATGGQDVVVFIIGMRVNRFRSPRQWMPVFNAMGPMIRELYTQKEHGFLSQEMSIGWRTITMIQYWRSTDDLFTYARANKHLTAWRNFNQKIAASKAVGIYHETYQLHNGQYETIYGNMPVHGLAKALGHHALTQKTETAKQRITPAETN